MEMDDEGEGGHSHVRARTMSRLCFPHTVFLRLRCVPGLCHPAAKAAHYHHLIL